MAERRRGEEIFNCRYARESRLRLANGIPLANCQHQKCDVIFSLNSWKGMPYCSRLLLDIDLTKRLLDRDRIRLEGTPAFERVIKNYQDRLQQLKKEADDLGISSLD